MLTLGVSGGIASGKSTVVERFKFHGACAIHADPIVHEVLTLPEIVEQMRAHWRVDMKSGMTRCDRFPPRCLIDEHGNFVRAGIARLVFDYTDELGFLERITYPLVDAKIKERHQLFGNGFHDVTVLDIPLMFEYEYDVLAQYLIFVECDMDTRVARYAARTLGTPAMLDFAKHDIEKRERRQLPLSYKKQFSTVHFDNNGTEAELIEQVDAFWKQIEEQKFSHADVPYKWHRHPNVE
jgi:dephospho-CoA kinase